MLLNVKGFCVPVGLPGVDGIPGHNGTDGIPGQNGLPGADGKRGKKGKEIMEPFCSDLSTFIKTSGNVGHFREELLGQYSSQRVENNPG